MIPVKKKLMITCEPFEENISTSCELIFRANQQHGCSQRSGQRAYDRLGFENATRRPSMSTTVCNLVVLLLYWPLFLFQEAAFTTVDFPWMFHYFGTQSTMQGEGWSTVMSNGSGRVRSSVADGLHRLGCPANLCWATGPLAENYSYISENISHITCIFDMILSVWYHLNLLGDSWHLGTSSSTDQRASLNPPCDRTNPKTDTWMDVGWAETLKDTKLALTSAQKKKKKN